MKIWKKSWKKRVCKHVRIRHRFLVILASFCLPSWKPKKWFFLNFFEVLCKIGPTWPRERHKSAPRVLQERPRAPKCAPIVSQEPPNTEKNQNHEKTNADACKNSQRLNDDMCLLCCQLRRLMWSNPSGDMNWRSFPAQTVPYVWGKPFPPKSRR